jgi:hypothetical protein
LPPDVDPKKHNESSIVQPTKLNGQFLASPQCIISLCLMKRNNMSLPYFDTASSLVSMLGLVPILLGLIRGLFPKSGWMFLFAAMSGLAGWCSLYFSILFNIWKQSLLDKQDIVGLGSNGASNAIVSIFGWLPGVFLFFLTLSLTIVFFRWLPSKRIRVNKTPHLTEGKAHI